MGALLSIPQRILNALLPFTNPNTPLAQDLIHTIILCGTLYFAPQLVEIYNHHAKQHWSTEEDRTLNHTNDNPIPEAPNTEPPVDANLVLQPDDEDPANPPPLAPTPPPVDPGVANWVPQPNHEEQLNFDDDAQAGPANERPRATPANRTVGAKKAKSLARKDQRRAYHEFHRQEAELRRLREAEGKEEREAALAAEKARRAEVEREIQDRERAERERKKEEERREQEAERARRERVVSEVREGLEGQGYVNLLDLAWKEGKDLVWVERLVRASGVLSKGEKQGSHTMITGAGWAVRVDAQLMREAYEAAAKSGSVKEGHVSFDEFAVILEKAVRAKSKA